MLCADSVDINVRCPVCIIPHASPNIFGSLFLALQAQYFNGYEDGWTDAEATLTEEQEFDC